MELDKTTLSDLSIFTAEEEFSVFNKLNFTRTGLGREQLRINFTYALQSLDEIRGVQQTIKFIKEKKQHWPLQINNGTLMVIERFYDATIDEIPANPGIMGTFNYKFFHRDEFSLVKYSAVHCFEFLLGLKRMLEHFLQEKTPAPLRKALLEIEKTTRNKEFDVLERFKSADEMPVQQMLQFTHFLRYNYKVHMYDLLDIYAQLDAWYGMAEATDQYGLVFPEFVINEQPMVSCKGLYHILLAEPVAYDVGLSPESNFLFLTGANMAGKSTFIKSMGIAVFLAHLGMGVPAKEMKLTSFDGLLSNINVVDNIVKGESYFFNEVQRIKTTIMRINNGKKWLIL
ncbi:MAG TPA: hypothetical protein VKH37_12715, partial [Ferruginibacter sp.]|nr:hypothetical protein [Ferruginibacter sp.]